jgi:hypothetical protein
MCFRQGYNEHSLILWRIEFGKGYFDFYVSLHDTWMFFRCFKHVYITKLNSDNKLLKERKNVLKS